MRDHMIYNYITSESGPRLRVLPLTIFNHRLTNLIQDVYRTNLPVSKNNVFLKPKFNYKHVHQERCFHALTKSLHCHR